MGYDIVGDIHGHADKLEALLEKLGYVQSSGGFRHPRRKAIFVGDFIDRGPRQLDTVAIVRPMVESGSALAVMGNHELNAIAWHTPDDSRPGEYLRPRFDPVDGPKNRDQHKEFLAEVGEDSDRHRDIVDWFLTLPLWLDLEGLRVVHACWHTRFMDWLSPWLREGRYLTRELLPAATLEPQDKAEKDNEEPSVFKAVEALTKGLEVPLPDGITFKDKGGVTRDRARIRWWDRDSTTYRSSALLPASTRETLPDDPIPAHARSRHPTDKPLFFGHYWMKGSPAAVAPCAACVDYSAGLGGPLVAYRWDGERVLEPGKFVGSES